MKNKKLITLILTLVAINAYSIINYEKGDSLYVWASEGLALQTRPDFSSEQIATIEFGETVICLSEKSLQNSVSRLTETQVTDVSATIKHGINRPALRLKGEWCKVIYNNSEGYVFDAYLSSLPPTLPNEWPEQYMARNFTITDTLTDYKQQGRKVREMKLFKAVYNNCIMYYKSLFTSSGIETIILPLSLEEAYLFYVGRFIKRENSGYSVILSTEDQMKFGYMMGTVEITKFNGFVVIEHEWGN